MDANHQHYGGLSQPFTNPRFKVLTTMYGVDVLKNIGRAKLSHQMVINAPGCGRDIVSTVTDKDTLHYNFPLGYRLRSALLKDR